MSTIATNIYRCIEYCNNCPFLDDGKKMMLNAGRVDNIKSYLDGDDTRSFSCHKTVHGLDNEMKNTEHQDPKMCKGAYDYLNKINRPNLMMRLAINMGID